MASGGIGGLFETIRVEAQKLAGLKSQYNNQGLSMLAWLGEIDGKTARLASTTTALGGAFRSTWGSLNPAAKISLATSAISLLIGIIAGVVSAIKEAQVTAESLQKEVDAIQEKINDLNSTLETNRDRIAEINSLKGTNEWTPTLEAEREELEKQNDALTVQIQHEERLMQIRSKARDAAKKKGVY